MLSDARFRPQYAPEDPGQGCTSQSLIWLVLLSATLLRALVSRGIPEAEGAVHAADPYVFQPGHAPGVDTHQHFDGVPGPGGYLGGGNA